MASSGLKKMLIYIILKGSILYDITFSHTPLGVSKLYRLTFSSDLRKPCCKLAKACLQIQNLVLLLRKLIITLIQEDLFSKVASQLSIKYVYLSPYGSHTIY